MSIHVANITGAPNLARQVIANASGTLREFAAVDQNAQGTGSLLAGLVQPVAANSTGDFFLMALLVDGPSKYGIFRDK